jgi:hypothetical protein
MFQMFPSSSKVHWDYVLSWGFVGTTSWLLSTPITFDVDRKISFMTIATTSESF